jgi:hypothetical protein
MIEGIFTFALPLATLLLAQPLVILITSVVLRLCGVPRQKVAEWALRQAGSRWLVDLLHAARGQSPMDQVEASQSEGGERS